MDIVKFFQEVRSNGLFTKLSDLQVRCMEILLDEWQDQGLQDIRWLAYMFATEYHETGRRMTPIEEIGKGKGRPYGKKIKHSGVAYTMPDKIYYGRGRVQLTWFENYQLMTRLLGVDLLNKPELAMDPVISAKIMFEGMLRGASSFGDFTGKCLEMYFNATTEDPLGARRIINGQDKAEDIKKYYFLFKSALYKATGKKL